MNIHILEEALMQLKDEDIYHLNRYKEELKNKNEEINTKKMNLNLLEDDKKRLELLNYICENKLKYYKNISSLIGIILPILYILIIPFVGISLPTLIILIILSTLSFAIFSKETICKISAKKYTLLDNYIFVIKKLLGNKKALKREYIVTSIDINSIIEEINELKELISSISSSIEELNDELAYIDGNLIGLDKLDNKYKITEIDDDNQIVQYINDKKRVLN